MKKNLFAAALLLSVSVSTAFAATNDSITFTVVKENPITSIKDQNRSGTCWCYSSLGFLEAELLRLGKGEYDLCESFVVHHTMVDRAKASVRLHGDISFSEGGSFYDVIYCMKHYGLAPQEAMPEPGTLQGDSLFNFEELSAVAGAVVEKLAKGKQKKLTPIWANNVSLIYDNYLGKLPEKFEYKGKTYTPIEFAQSLGLNPDDYVSAHLVHTPSLLREVRGRGTGQLALGTELQPSAQRIHGSNGLCRAQRIHLCMGFRRERKRLQLENMRGYNSA